MGREPTKLELEFAESLGKSMDREGELIDKLQKLRARLAAAERERDAARHEIGEAKRKLSESQARAGRLEGALTEAWIDIGRWIRLALYQRQQMDQNLGWCPTQHGIDESDLVRRRISAALAEPAADAGKEEADVMKAARDVLYAYDRHERPHKPVGAVLARALEAMRDVLNPRSDADAGKRGGG